MFFFFRLSKFEKEFKDLKIVVDDLCNEADYEDETETEDEACACCKDSNPAQKEV